MKVFRIIILILFMSMSINADTVILQPGETYIVEQNGYDDLTGSQQLDRAIPAILIAFLICVL